MPEKMEHGRTKHINHNKAEQNIAVQEGTNVLRQNRMPKNVEHSFTDRTNVQKTWPYYDQIRYQHTQNMAVLSVLMY